MKPKNKEKEDSKLFPESLIKKWRSKYFLSIYPEDKSVIEYHRARIKLKQFKSVKVHFKALARYGQLRRYLGRFLENEDIKHVLQLISFGYIEHPLIEEIIDHLRIIIMVEKRFRRNHQRKEAESYMKKIERAFHQFLIYPISLVKVPPKEKRLLGVIEIILTKKGELGGQLLKPTEKNSTVQSQKTITRAKVLGYILERYRENRKQLRRRGYSKTILLNTAFDELEEKRGLLEVESSERMKKN